jgi:hypothetical protein
MMSSDSQILYSRVSLFVLEIKRGHVELREPTPLFSIPDKRAVTDKPTPFSFANKLEFNAI